MQQYFSKKCDNKTLFLESFDENHIKNVMRFKSGDKVFIVYEGTQYLCEFNKDLLSANIIEQREKYKETDIIAYIPVLQEEKMKFVIEKGTEMGVTKFIPVMFERCKYHLNKEAETKKLIRWNKISKEAAEQSRRLIIPEVANVVKIDKIEETASVNILCSLDKESVKSIKEVLNTDNIHDTITMLFGPEGGITKEEEDILEKKGFIKTSLGSTVLRTETVIISLMSIVNYLRM